MRLDAYSLASDFNGPASAVALDLSAGHANWAVALPAKTPTPQDGASRPVLALSGGALLVAYGSNTLSALNPQDGATLWRATISGGLAGVTAVG